MKDLVKLFSKNFFVLLTIGAGIHSGHSFAQKVTPPAAAASFPLSLTGTVIGADGKNKAVVMDETDKKQYLLKVGDTVRDIVVQQVERGKIVLMKDGKKTTLRLKNRKGEGKASLPTVSEDTALPSPPPAPALKVPALKVPATATAAPAMDEAPATTAPAMDEAPTLAAPPPPPAPAPPPVQ